MACNGETLLVEAKDGLLRTSLGIYCLYISCERGPGGHRWQLPTIAPTRLEQQAHDEAIHVWASFMFALIGISPQKIFE